MTTVWFSLINSDEKDSEEVPFHLADKYIRPLIGKPLEIGCFSVDSKSSVHFDKSHLKYLISSLRTNDIHFDLNLNFDIDQHNFHYFTLGKMHKTLFWLLNSKNSPHYKNSKEKIDFISSRGTLRLIACTPYLKGCLRDQWEICASKLNGTIYFAAIDTDFDIEQNNNITYRRKKFQSWGYKFEQFLTTDTIDGEPNIESTTFQLEEFYVILKNAFDKYSLIYSAEIDAAVPHRHPGPGSGSMSCYTELKTSRMITTDSQKYYYHSHKLMVWWAQSFFTGIPEVICGVRDDDGIVKKLEILSVSKMPEKAWGWLPEVCLSFCIKFLKFLEKTVIEDDPNIVYKFHYKTGDTIYCTKLSHPDERYRVIPEWYVEGIKKL